MPVQSQELPIFYKICSAYIIYEAHKLCKVYGPKDSSSSTKFSYKLEL